MTVNSTFLASIQLAGSSVAYALAPNPAAVTAEGISYYVPGSADSTSDAVRDEDNVEVRISPLTSADFDQVHTTICRGFSTDAFQFRIAAADLNERLIQNGYDPQSSLGVFVDDSMIGVWLTGIRMLDGARTAYGAGTAVLHEWRRKGIAQAMASIIEGMSIKSETEKFVLTTFTDNIPAISLYEKNGFFISRPMVSYRIDAPSFSADAANDIEVVQAGLKDVIHLRDRFLGFEPSWRNSWQSIEAIEKSIVTALVRKGSEEIAYGIFQPISGRIAQIGVKAMGGQDELDTLIGLLAYFQGFQEGTSSMEIVEIPKDFHRLISLFRNAGFEQSQSLVEMIREYQSPLR
jgi:ribosomal protein S18 acetylase RimI-like enzyme